MYFPQKKPNSYVFMNIYRILIAIFYSAICTETMSQSKKSSVQAFIYNLKDHRFEGNPIIPFDQAFTIKVPDLSGKSTQYVRIFKSEISNGKRNWSTSKVIDCKNKKKCAIIFDKELSFDNTSDTLNIFIDPLKPNKLFDIVVGLNLSENLRNILMQVNSLLISGDKEKAEIKYIEFWNKSFTREEGLGGIDMDFESYYDSIYIKALKKEYEDLFRKKMNESEKQITLNELHLLGIISENKENYTNRILPLYKTIRDKNIRKSITGLHNISDSYSDEITVEITDFSKRDINLKSNICFFDSLLSLLDKIALEETIDTTKKHTNDHLIEMREKITTIRLNMYKNRRFLEEKLKKIDEIINTHTELTSRVVLSGNTLASDLKTDGGRILFMDAGLTNIFINDINNDLLYIPRLHMGVNIYFRAVNKNIRTNTLYRKRHFNLSRRCSYSEDGKEIYSPDYQVISRRNIFQRYC